MDYPLITTISYVGNLVAEELNKKLGEISLSATKLSALDHIQANSGPVVLSELAENKGCVKSNITQLIDRMESEGLVKRMRSEKDRRKVIAEITPKGKKLHKQGLKLLADTHDEILAGFSDQERQTLAHLLFRMIDE